MLSRTADHLYWMARYTERAENTARMLGVSLQTSLLPQPEASVELLWRGMLGICELQPQYDDRFPSLAPQSVMAFMASDPSNLSSICACLRAARENARAVRGALTTEVWETINSTWLELRGQLYSVERDPAQFCEWVKHRSHLSRGVMIGTMLRDESLYFSRLGTFLERADNTARILDVRYHGLAGQATPGAATRAEREGEEDLTFYHWAAVLRSVSAFEVYRKVYRDAITPARVAELLILRPDMPRSLLSCVNEVVSNLEQVRNGHSRETERRAGQLRADLHYGDIDAILEEGLHAYLTRFLQRVNELGDRISRDFLVPIATA
jgi:uncharacterized alpha-E superfamily protein